MWHPKTKRGDGSRSELVQCPVCKTVLGDRDYKTIFIAHCEECRATFCWKPGKDKPTATLDKDKPQRCGCGSCGR